MAGRIPHSFIDDLLARVDIVAVIGDLVPLKQKGREYTACCPFHNEKTPSFSVSREKQMYYCFGCGAGGSAITFLMNYQHLDFIEAVESLAQRLNLEIPREGGSHQSTDYKPLLDVLERTATFYTRQLLKHPPTQSYLQQRGIDQETADLFRLGYAPDGFDNLNKLAAAGKEKMFFKAGLLKNKNNQTYASFRNRLMFPIRDRRGRTIAFGGRVLAAEQQPKYLNSPETEVFHKRRTLYGVCELKQAKKLNEIVVVEGYMDVVSLAAHGIYNCVASLGTAITQDHVKQLFKLCPRVLFCFDGDLAGHKAAAAALTQTLSLMRDGYDAGFVFLPDQEDPDTIVKNKGKEHFEDLLKQATPLSEFAFNHLADGLNLSTPEGGAAFAERARPLLATMLPGTLHDLTVNSLAQKAGLQPHDLIQKTSKEPVSRTSQPRRTGKHHYSAIRLAALHLVRNPELIKQDNVLSGDKIGKLQQPGASFLADMIEKIGEFNVSNTPSLLALYKDNESESIVKRLAEWSPPETGKEIEEFRHIMDNLRKQLAEQEQARLIETSRQRPLSTEEKDKLRKLQQSAGHP